MLMMIFILFFNFFAGAFVLLAAGLCAIGSAIGIFLVQPYDAIFRWVSIYTFFTFSFFPRFSDSIHINLIAVSMVYRKDLYKSIKY